MGTQPQYSCDNHDRGRRGQAGRGCDDVYRQSENKDLSSEEQDEESPRRNTAGDEIGGGGALQASVMRFDSVTSARQEQRGESTR